MVRYISLFVCGCALLWTAEMIGQDNDARTLSNLGSAISTTAPGSDLRYEETVGSPYLYDNWLNGTLYLKDGRFVQRDAAFNVDATERGGIVVLLPGGDAIDVRESLITEVVIVTGTGDVHYKPFPAKQFDERVPGTWMVQVLYEDDDVAFLRHDSKYLKRADYTGAYSANRRYDEYVDETAYFVMKNGQVSKVRLKKNSIEEVLPEVASKLKGSFTEADITATMRDVYGQNN